MDEVVTLASYPFVAVRVRCDQCKRSGVYRLARLAEAFGAEASMDAVVGNLTHDCPWRLDRNEKRRKYQAACFAFLPDLHSPPRPPDLPPGMMKLAVVKGGKA